MAHPLLLDPPDADVPERLVPSGDSLFHRVVETESRGLRELRDEFGYFRYRRLHLALHPLASRGQPGKDAQRP